MCQLGAGPNWCVEELERGAMAFNARNPALRDLPTRKGEFREAAREIVWKDRESRKLGQSVDTAGAIARALEAAYRLGVAHGANAGASEPAARDVPVAPAGSIAWNTIPPRPRAIFERILLFKWLVRLVPNTSPWLKQSDRWACYWDWGDSKPEGQRYELADTFSRTTLAPIVRLGLMEELEVGGRTALEPTQLAVATWERAMAEGHVREYK